MVQAHDLTIANPLDLFSGVVPVANCWIQADGKDCAAIVPWQHLERLRGRVYKQIQLV